MFRPLHHPRRVAVGLTLALMLTLSTPAFSQTDPSPTDGTPVVQETVHKISFLQLLSKGGLFMIPIGAFSLLGVAIIIERALALRHQNVMPAEFLPGLRERFHGPADMEKALAYCREHPSPISRIMAQGIRKLPHGQEAIESAIEDAGALEVARLRRNLRTLNAIAAVAPMLGLLGTVWGMIEAFQSAAAKGMGRPEVLATGIYEALVTTLSGLAVAITMAMCYYFFLGKIDEIVARINDLCESFVEHLERHNQPAPAVTPAAPAPHEHIAPHTPEEVIISARDPTEV